MKNIIGFFGIFFLYLNGYSQDLDELMSEATDKKTQYISSSFKSSRVINLHSLENTHKGNLDFRISHRFGVLSGGFRELFGLDGPALIRFSLEYGLTDRFMLGVSRSNYQKVYEGYFKYKLLRQSTGKVQMPISLLWYANLGIRTADFPNSERDYDFPNRVFYTHQLIIGRKFSDGFSMQISPSVVHKNLVEKESESNDIFALGIAGRLKISQRTALTGEYVFLLNSEDDLPKINGLAPKNSISLGVDIETGGHVFQLHLSNSTALHESGFITGTTQAWGDGDIHFGFNILRAFGVK